MQDARNSFRAAALCPLSQAGAGSPRSAKSAFVHRALGLLGVAVLLLPLGNAVSSTVERFFRWQEEFVLDTGEALLLQRTERFRYGTAPDNPRRVGWIPEESTIVVIRGPQDLEGARYTLNDWMSPVLLERDPTTRALVLVSTTWNCYRIMRFSEKQRRVYKAFRLRPNLEAEEIDFPHWTWGKPRKLYLAQIDNDPPARLTAATAERHNRTIARGHKIYFSVDREDESLSCEGTQK